MSEQKYYLITKEDAEVILNKSKRLTWDDANEVMAIIKDLKAVNAVSRCLFRLSPVANKFSGTGDRE